MSKEVKGFQLLLKWEKLESVNRMYIRTRTGMTLSPEARKFKRDVGKQVRAQLPDVLPFGPKDVFRLSLQFVIKNRFFVRDTSNFIKLVEDTIFEELDINDARNIEVIAKKSHVKDSKYEYIKATIEKSDFNYNYFNEDDPIHEVTDKSFSENDLENAYMKGVLDARAAQIPEDLPQDKLMQFIKQKLAKKENG